MTDTADSRAQGYLALARTIAVANDKGGVGKTSLTANLGALYATAGYRVLLVDMNRQANLSDDLGYRHSPIDDQGAGLLMSLISGTVLRAVPVPGRPGLFVIPGGTRLGDLTGVMVGRISQHGREAMLALANVLAPIAADYDLVLIDTPPENTLLVDLALACARRLLMPTKSDAGGLVGMQLLAERFTVAREVNPALTLLGVVLFGTTRGATAIHRTVRSSVQTAFGTDSPVLAATIGHSERIATATRARGRVAHELESDAANQPAWWEALRAAGQGDQAQAGPRAMRIPATAATVAEDYRKLAAEVLDLLAVAEAGG